MGGWTNVIWLFNLFLNLHKIKSSYKYTKQYFTFFATLNHQRMAKQKQEWTICMLGWRINKYCDWSNKKHNWHNTNVSLQCSGCCDWKGQKILLWSCWLFIMSLHNSSFIEEKSKQNGTVCEFPNMTDPRPSSSNNKYFSVSGSSLGLSWWTTFKMELSNRNN